MDDLANQQLGGSKVAPGFVVGNLGRPLFLRDVKINGIAAEAARPNDQLKVWTRLALTSDDPMFHRTLDNLGPIFRYLAAQAGHPVNLNRVETLLLVIHQDDTAELWIDQAATTLKVMPRKKMEAGTVVFEHDIADITGMDFPSVEITPTDRVVCIFRVDWRFGFFADFNSENNLSRERMCEALGALYRTLKFRHLYDLLANNEVFTRLTSQGWFPFSEILGREFLSLARSCEAGFELDDEESKVVAAFDGPRIERILARWLDKPAFKEKEAILVSAGRALKGNDPVAAIKILLTEIEGVLASAYRTANGSSAKMSDLVRFALESAKSKAGASDTLLLPEAFGQYLKAYTFATFDPTGPLGEAGSRHAVGHGAAAAQTYTMVCAIQAFLTLDQLAFYLP